MNPNDKTVTELPFFAQLLESQRSDVTDTLEAAAGACNFIGATQTPWGCWMDTKKYPSDGDDQSGPLF